jgi:hypothetical protein
MPKSQPKTTQDKAEVLQGKIDLIDHLLDWHCKCELPAATRLYLRNLRYEYKCKLDEISDVTY